MTGAPRKTRRRPILTVLSVLGILVFGGVALYRFLPPPQTWLMTLRLTQGEGRDYRWRSLDDISPRLVDAVIASEDATFCAHSGFDMKAIEKARASNARGKRIRGGSTISQQTAKNLFLWSGEGWTRMLRKGIEAWYTVLIEALWPKQRILEVYANIAEFGDGVYGAQAAARTYFRKDAGRLGSAEAARLAAVLPSPRRYSASRPGPYVQRRTRAIQRQMRAIGGTGHLKTLE